MADEEKPAPAAPAAAPPAEPPATPEAPEAPSKPTARKSDARLAQPREPIAERAVEEAQKKASGKHPKAPRRAVLDPELRRLLDVRASVGDRRPRFVRTASHRYARIGRWESWRAPKGLQSKQRRHYGYRPKVVSIGYGSPKRTRGLTPTGFEPVIVRTAAEIDALDRDRQAAVIARTVGTRRRLALEESARKRGVHVLNPITSDRRET